MHTITIFGMKGGTGRTILTMALASGLVAKGRRVAIMDTTDDADYPASCSHPAWMDCSHTAWAAKQHDDGISPETLRVVPVKTGADLADALARTRRSGAEIALIDTRAHLTPHHAAAAEKADLVLMPFIGWVEAETISANVEGAGDRAPIFGVNAGVKGDAVRCRHAASLFGGPMLHTAMPHSELLARMPVEGRIDRLVAALDDRESAGAQNTRASGPAKDIPGLAEIEAMRHAWVQVQELATEVLWMLQGQMLKPALVNLPPHTHAPS